MGWLGSFELILVLVLDRSESLVYSLGLEVDSLGYFESTGLILLFQRFNDEVSFGNTFGQRIYKTLGESCPRIHKVNLMTHQVSPEHLRQQRLFVALRFESRTSAWRL